MEESLRTERKKWLFNMSPDENNLFDLISEYEKEYFGDLTFKPNSIVAPFIEYQEEINGAWETVYADVPLEMSSIDAANYRYYVREIEDGVEGVTDTVNRIIIIPPRNLNDKSTILHEMIHAYESVIDKWLPFFKEILITCLYKFLKERISDLDDRIVAHAQIYVSEQTFLQGGPHGVMFFLKSLDLDLRCGYKLGTVCGYGRDE